jgi:hypothetical protein
MFWTGLITGLFIGATAGLLGFAIFASKKEGGSCTSNDSESSKLMDAVCTVVTIDACLPNETNSG